MTMMKTDLSKYYTFGLSLLQLMFVIGSFGLVAAAIYEYLPF